MSTRVRCTKAYTCVHQGSYGVVILNISKTRINIAADDNANIETIKASEESNPGISFNRLFLSSRYLLDDKIYIKTDERTSSCDAERFMPFSRIRSTIDFDMNIYELMFPQSGNGL